MPVIGEEFEAGRNAYRSLIICVDTAIENENPDIAVICGSALLQLTKSESANYFGDEPPFDYNTALATVRKALEYGKEEGVPSWLKDDLKEMEEQYIKIYHEEITSRFKHSINRIQKQEKK